MADRPGQSGRGRVALGEFVSADLRLGVGRLVEAGAGVSTIRYFKGPMKHPFVEVECPTSEVKPVRLALNSRVFFLHAGHWRVGRIDAVPSGADEGVVVALPNSQGIVLPPEVLEIRWRRPIDDPFAFLSSGGTESPLLADVRTSFLAGWRAQRAASHGVEGLLLSSVELHAHQVSAVRRASSDPVLRYLLADEVGLGKTIEAGALIRQRMSEGSERVLVLVPDHLCGQWASELAGRFQLEVGSRLQIHGHSGMSGWPIEVPDLLIVDEAHHMTRTGVFPPDVRDKVRHLAIAAGELLLLTATPVRSNEAGFLDLLSMLDPDRYRPDDLEEFTRRVDARDELALIHRSLESVEDVFEFSYLSNRLRELFPGDRVLTDLIDAAEAAGDAELAPVAFRIRSHLSETYRLHHRMIRTRRTPELTQAFGVRGRRRGRPFTLEVDDQTDAIRLDLLEFVRSRLGAALDEEVLSSSSAAAVFREVGARCGSLPVALQSVAADFGEFGELRRWLSEPDHRRIVHMAEQIAASWAAFRPVFVESLSSLVAARSAGRVVLASAFSESAAAAFAAMEDRWGSHRVALHSVANSARENDNAVERWRTDPSCNLLFCDGGAEEGVNLQSADLLVHLDLPWHTSRLEQRLGRCDRFREGIVEPISSTIVMYGDQPFSAGWFEFAADAAHVFDRSVSSLQYVLADVEREVLEMAVRGGPSAMADSTFDFEARLAQESIRITAQDSLDAVSVPSSHLELIELDNDRGFTAAMTTWLESVGCGVKHVRPGVIVLQPRGRVQVPFDLEMSITRWLKVPLALSREASVADKVEILRAGHPLVDSIAVHLAESDRGVAFAMFRHASGIWPPAVVARADVLSSVDAAAVQALEGLPEELGLRVLDLCAELLPPVLESVWFFPNGDEVTHPSVLRPYSRESGDVNLGSRPETFESLTSHIDWASLCDRGSRIALDLIGAREVANSNRAERVEGLVALVMTEVDQRRSRAAAGLSGDEWSVDGDTLERLRNVLLHPGRAVIGAGAVFLADRKLAGIG